MPKRKNKYEAESYRLLTIKCDRCEQHQVIVEGYAYYFKEYQEDNPGVMMTCPNCDEGRLQI